MTIEALHNDIGKSGILPVVGPLSAGDIYTVAGTYTLTAPAGATLLAVEVLAGLGWVRPSTDGADTFPGTWPPAANVTDGSAMWLKVISGGLGERREIACSAGDLFRLEVESGAEIQALWH